MPADTQRAKLLLEAGVDALATRGDHIRAEAFFQEAKRLAEDAETRNQARLYLATVYCIRYVPGVCEAEAEENARWLQRAEAQYFEVMDTGIATAEHADAAMKGLGAIQVHRRYDRASGRSRQNENV